MSVYQPIGPDKNLFAGMDALIHVLVTNGLRSTMYPGKKGTPIDVSGKTLEFAVFREADGDLLFVKSGVDITLFDTDTTDSITNDGVAIKLAAADTVNQSTGAVIHPAAIYYYELRVIDAGDKHPLCHGPIAFKSPGKR